MASTKVHLVGSVALRLSLLTFAFFFLNVLIGGPLGMQPWMSDVAEMLTLLVAVILFVAGTIAREYESDRRALEVQAHQQGRNGNGPATGRKEHETLT